MDRRRFIGAGIAGVAGLSIARPGLAEMKFVSPSEAVVDKVKLGDTGLTVSRIAMGSGTKGWNRQSNQTRLGMKQFVNMAHHGYERGIRFFDMADAYGSQPFFGASILNLPRENITLMTKMWTVEDSVKEKEPVRKTIDRFRQETGSDYIDILLLHCMTQGNWVENRKYYMDGFSEAKQEGIVKAVGVSCHNWEAMVQAVDNPWVDVILARINPFQALMDNTPEMVSELLGKAKAKGKGVIGMKIFGEGKHVTDEERERSIRYALTEGNIHAMTLGLESVAQMDDAIERVMRLSK
jgi:predicted aldo/keto reductase-like oxidoreductase